MNDPNENMIDNSTTAGARGDELRPALFVPAAILVRKIGGAVLLAGYSHLAKYFLRIFSKN